MNEQEQDTFWDWFMDLPWWGILWTLLVIVMLIGAGFAIYRGVVGYRTECHNAGGHIIDVRDADICVDRDNRVIFL